MEKVMESNTSEVIKTNEIKKKLAITLSSKILFNVLVM
jgi:hypothetical protein